MPYWIPLQQAKAEALAAAAEAAASTAAVPTAPPVPDGYYARTNVPETEVDECLATLGIHRNARQL
ncbi:hypothetical protein OOK13_39145 [Streptomyces sp. NBC_00378]|uniref:hypothetical protein n=1 Tax=unclassified Streptomyces TaxID=2593676 RepID=UPI002252ADF7|nr:MULTISPECIES: hypothetical protein [unclassified Streptomyces]MCX5114376.1 hypothetical protein [Streptomyces sp. NBC_00378]